VGWAKADQTNSFADMKREVTVKKITARNNYYLVDFMTVITPPSGNRYTADGQFMLMKNDGEWKIWSMTNELFKRDTETWKLLDE